MSELLARLFRFLSSWLPFGSRPVPDPEPVPEPVPPSPVEPWPAPIPPSPESSVLTAINSARVTRRAQGIGRGRVDVPPRAVLGRLDGLVGHARPRRFRRSDRLDLPQHGRGGGYRRRASRTRPPPSPHGWTTRPTGRTSWAISIDLASGAIGTRRVRPTGASISPGSIEPRDDAPSSPIDPVEQATGDGPAGVLSGMVEPEAGPAVIGAARRAGRRRPRRSRRARPRRTGGRGAGTRAGRSRRRAGRRPCSP